MKAGDEVKAGKLTYEEFLDTYRSMTRRQIVYLEMRQTRQKSPFAMFQRRGVPSDAELQRREGS